MKKSIVFFASAALLLAVAFPASAQNARDGFTHSVEAVFGTSVQMYKYAGETSTAHGMASGANLALRYTCFFPNDFGVYAQLTEENVFAGDESFFGTVNKADGGKFLYRFNRGGEYSSYLDPVFTVGAVYRWSYGNLDLVPRLGLGVGQYYIDDYSFERRARSGDSGPEYFTYEEKAYPANVDYLIEGRTYYDTPPAMVLSASFQASYHFSGVWYAFAEAGMNWAATSFNMERSVVSTRNGYNPSNWAEAVAWSDAKGKWVVDPDSRVSVQESVRPLPFVHFNLGIGISFGRKYNR